jgi:hypothetical protein
MNELSGQKCYFAFAIITGAAWRKITQERLIKQTIILSNSLISSSYA